MVNTAELEDDLLKDLQQQLFDCCDELGSAGCGICSEQKVCEKKWLGVRAKRNNGTILTTTEFRYYSTTFSEIRCRRQILMVLPAKHGVDSKDGAGAKRNQ